MTVFHFDYANEGLFYGVLAARGACCICPQGVLSLAATGLCSLACPKEPKRKAVPHLSFRLRAGAMVRTLGRPRLWPTRWLGSACWGGTPSFRQLTPTACTSNCAKADPTSERTWLLMA
ncbi:hypothetical protein [Parapedobacter sp. 10938]|uniref:hypothetical protein n=1 Tax=Parapedobacter flavus TaxID=3110225 RepID=UPI002DBA431E|nr:hypothetical protein [Parapedobacter sp. 10938]MEC3880957.1 hypothetical protein [Parapedobacter sp. 10938]